MSSHLKLFTSTIHHIRLSIDFEFKQTTTTDHKVESPVM